jgi:hypothetical protein
MDGAIFICFSSKDLTTALRVVEALEGHRLPCWISARDVLAGQNYQEQIVSTLEHAKGVVFLFSEASSESAEIRKELSIAASVQIPVFPLRLSPILPTGALRYELATRQWIDFFPDESKAVATLAQTIKKVTAADRPVAEPTVVPPPTPTEAAPRAAAQPVNDAQPASKDGILPAGSEEFEAIRILLARQIGPIAKVLMQKTARDATSLDDFCERLANHISAQGERKAFLQAAQVKLAARRGRA